MSEPPMLIIVIGPPAVGKMTVGHEIAARTGLKLFHNHLAIEPVLRFFDFGTPAFTRLVRGFRTALMNEVAAGDLPGLIFTYVWSFDEPGDAAEVERFAAPFRARGGRVLYVELSATRKERERRNVGEFRLAEKASKRDLARSRELLFGLDDKYQLESAGFFAGRADYLHVDNTHLEAAAVAELVIRHFALTRAAPKPEA